MHAQEHQRFANGDPWRKLIVAHWNQKLRKYIMRSGMTHIPPSNTLENDSCTKILDKAERLPEPSFKLAEPGRPRVITTPGPPVLWTSGSSGSPVLRSSGPSGPRALRSSGPPVPPVRLQSAGPRVITTSGPPSGSFGSPGSTGPPELQTSSKKSKIDPWTSKKNEEKEEVRPPHAQGSRREAPPGAPPTPPFPLPGGPPGAPWGP